MKYIIALLFLLTSCCKDTSVVRTDPSTLKFHAGNMVTTNVDGFYSSCRGEIISYYLYHNRNSPNRYTVSFQCSDKNVNVGETVMEESDLIFYNHPKQMETTQKLRRLYNRLQATTDLLNKINECASTPECDGKEILKILPKFIESNRKGNF